MTRRLLLLTIAVTGLLLTFPTTASAHPLGNFTVNHYHGLAFDPDGLTDIAVLDSAEIPTKQAAGDVDANGDGEADAPERTRYAIRRCAALVDSLEVLASGDAVTMRVSSASFAYRTGQAGLDVSRLECRLRGDVDLSAARTIEVRDRFESGRVGWREMTAVARGVHLNESPIPAKSVSGELTSYPNDLLSSPLDVREAIIEVLPGAGASTVADSIDTASKAGPFTQLIDRITGTFNDLVGRDHLTLNVGLLAVGLALLLGASHAVLPGHGKTVMAAYIAGRQGSMRDAVVVGATVTATHTTGVIVLGLALTVSSSLAGDEVLRWLGATSGLLVAALGVSLLANTIRHKAPSHGHSHGFGGHTHSHTHSHEPHAAPVTSHRHEPARVLVSAGSSHTIATGHRPAPTEHRHADPRDMHHDHDHDHDRTGVPRVLSRRGLITMGFAGGLVPSPSALVVLLAAIALGRTIFGVLLVLCYGIGMAATLTATGLVLVKLRDRYEGRAAERFSRRFALSWTRFIPYTTGTIVVAVGLLLTTRSLFGTV